MMILKINLSRNGKLFCLQSLYIVYSSKASAMGSKTWKFKTWGLQCKNETYVDSQFNKEVI